MGHPKIQKPKSPNKKTIVTIITVVIAIILIVSAIFVWASYCFTNSPSSVFGDFNALKFKLNGDANVDFVSAQTINFLTGNFNISIPCGDSYISALEVRVSSQSNANLDTIIFNSTGSLNIAATDMMFFTFQQMDNQSSTLKYRAPNLSSFIIDSDYPTTALTIDGTIPPMTEASITTAESKTTLLLTFVSTTNGSLSINGDDSFSISSIYGYVGIRLTVINPINRAYSININGDISQISADKWSIMKCSFFPNDTLDNGNGTITIYNPKGELSYNSKEVQLSGSQSVEFNGVWGQVYVMPTSDQFTYRIVISGDVSSVKIKSADNTLNLTQRNPIDDIPLPLGLIWIALSLILYRYKKRIDLMLIPLLILLLGLLAWSVQTQQAIWIQSLLGSAPLIITVAIFLLEVSRKRNE